MKGKKSLKSKLLETLARVGKIEEGGLEEEEETILDNMKNPKIEETNSKKNSKELEKACIKGVYFENEGFYIDGAELLAESEEKLPISKKDLDILNDETKVKISENQPENAQKIEKNEEVLESNTIKEKPNSNKNAEIFKTADFTEENESLIQKLNERIQKIEHPPKENPKTKASKPNKISNPAPCDVFLDFCRKNYLKTMKNPELSENPAQNKIKSEQPSEDIDNPTLPLQTSPEDAQTIKTLKKELQLKKKLIKSLISPPPAIDLSNSIKSVLFPEFLKEVESIPLNSPASPTHRLPKSLLLKAEAFLKQIQGILKEKTLKIDPTLLSELKLFIYSTKGLKNGTEIKKDKIGLIKEETKEGAKLDGKQEEVIEKRNESTKEEDSRQTQNNVNEDKKEEEDRPTENERNESTKEKETRLTEPRKNGRSKKERQQQPQRNVNEGAKEEDSRQIKYRKAFAFLKKCVEGVSAKKLKELNKGERIGWTAWIGVVVILAQFNEEIRINLRKSEEKDEWIESFLEKYAKNLVWLKGLPSDIENKQNFSENIEFFKKIMKEIEEIAIPEEKISKENKDAVKLVFAIENFIRVLKQQDRLKVRIENNDFNPKKNEEILSKNLRKNREEREKELKLQQNAEQLANCGIDFLDWEQNLQSLEKELKQLKKNKNDNRGISEKKVRESQNQKNKDKPAKKLVERDFEVNMQKIDKTLNKYKESHELNEDKLEYLRLFKQVQTQDQNQRAKHEISYYKEYSSKLLRKDNSTKRLQIVPPKVDPDFPGIPTQPIDKLVLKAKSFYARQTELLSELESLRKNSPKKQILPATTTTTSNPLIN